MFFSDDDERRWGDFICATDRKNRGEEVRWWWWWWKNFWRLCAFYCRTIDNIFILLSRWTPAGGGREFHKQQTTTDEVEHWRFLVRYTRGWRRSEIRNIRGEEKCYKKMWERGTRRWWWWCGAWALYNCFLSFFSLSLPLRCVPVLELESVRCIFKGNGRCTHKSQTIAGGLNWTIMKVL